MNARQQTSCGQAHLSAAWRLRFQHAPRREYAEACPAPQVRDEYRTDWDAGRGGYGNIVKEELSARQVAVVQNMDLYAEGQGEDGMDVDAAA